MSETQNNIKPPLVAQQAATGGVSDARLYQPAPIEGVSFSGLLANRILAALPGEDFARLLVHLEPVTFASGEDLYKFEADVEFAYFPENVVVSRVQLLADGSMTEVALIGREGMTGLSAIFNPRQRTLWTQVLVPGSALRMKTSILKQEFDRSRALQSLLLGYTGARIAQISQKAVCNGRHKLEERLCSWLLMIADRAGDTQLPLTHEQMARHLGVRRAGVTTIAHDLRDKDVISYSRGRIRILDRQAMEATACECYQTLKSSLH
jgi:CRP-like cAMP-binding protein